MKAFFRPLILAVSLGALFFPTFLLAGQTKTKDAVQPRPEIYETEAYKQFSQKPQNDFAKLIFLMNYYRNADFTIIFDGADYTPQFAFPFAQVYLFTHYNNEKAAKWIKTHCYRSPFQQNIIYLRFPSGRYKPARDIILKDLAALEKALKKDQQGKA